MTITLDTWAYCKLLEGGWYGSHLTHDILEKAIALWWHDLSAEERAEVLAHFAGKERDGEATGKRTLQEHLLCRYDAALEVLVDVEGEKVSAYRFGEELHISPSVRLVKQVPEPAPAKKGPRPPFVEHCAGVPILGLQCCVECGEVLVDQRQMASTDGTPAGFWAVGALYQDGNFWMSELPKRVKVVMCKGDGTNN